MSNDRFKFRFWDNHDKKFYDESEFALADLQICDAYGTFEQCTGIKDQSSKLIFEGDVVDYYSPMADEHYQGVVTFDDDEHTASGYYIKGNRKGYDSYLDGSHCRIIGNVHQMEDFGNEHRH